VSTYFLSVVITMSEQVVPSYVVHRIIIIIIIIIIIKKPKHGTC